jgi:hypothetical protein
MTRADRRLCTVRHVVAVKGSGGVSATMIVTVRRGLVWISIEPPFTWEAILEPGKVDELVQTLRQAATAAKGRVSGNQASDVGTAGS